MFFHSSIGPSINSSETKENNFESIIGFLSIIFSYFCSSHYPQSLAKYYLTPHITTLNFRPQKDCIAFCLHFNWSMIRIWLYEH